MLRFDFDKKLFSMIIIMSLIYFIPVLLSSHYYVDDLGRSIYGYSKWSENGRPLADVLFLALSFGPQLPDISPLPQLLALCVLSFSVYLSAKAFLTDYNRYVSSIISMVAISSPFLLENISYKYDSFPMSLSVLCAVFPFIFKELSLKKHFVYCCTAVLLILCIYQASINIYIIFAILYVLSLFRLGEVRKGLLTIISSISGLSLSYLIYSVFISPNFLAGSYNLRHSELATSGFSDALEVLSKNTTEFGKLINLAVTTPFIFLSVVTLMLCVISLTKIAIVKCNSTKLEKLLMRLVVIISPFAVLCMITGPMMLLRDPVLSPRVLMAFGTACFFFAVLAAWAFSAAKIYRKFCGVLFTIYAIYFIGFSYAYANSLNNQEKYENAIIQLMMSDLNGLDLNNYDYVAFNGGVLLSPEVRMAAKKYPLITRLIQPTINNQWIWGHTQMMHFDFDKKFQSFDYH
ncbi:glucosyltransferase domain-containing protein, partial [Enterobacter hormaechei]